MTTDEPLELTVQKMNHVMDEMEKLLEHTSSSAKSGHPLRHGLGTERTLSGQIP